MTPATMYVQLLDDWCTAITYPHEGTDQPHIGDYTSCRHSPPVAWDPTTGQVRKYDSDRRVVAVATVEYDEALARVLT